MFISNMEFLNNVKYYTFQFWLLLWLLNTNENTLLNHCFVSRCILVIIGFFCLLFLLFYVMCVICIILHHLRSLHVSHLYLALANFVQVYSNMNNNYYCNNTLHFGDPHMTKTKQFYLFFRDFGRE